MESDESDVSVEAETDVDNKIYDDDNVADVAEDADVKSVEAEVGTEIDVDVKSDESKADGDVDSNVDDACADADSSATRAVIETLHTQIEERDSIISELLHVVEENERLVEQVQKIDTNNDHIITPEELCQYLKHLFP